ncbi:protein of unknown function (plasmid) [Methylocella tundrae]|uniref:Uncharacterized protein n=1 Tax=Methylocella tundrae TaxID=227605 RepID=A0A4U8Z7K8_METTU|nr:protein of unknown function [Methylocella tundrae]
MFWIDYWLNQTTAAVEAWLYYLWKKGYI